METAEALKPESSRMTVRRTPCRFRLAAFGRNQAQPHLPGRTGDGALSLRFEQAAKDKPFNHYRILLLLGLLFLYILIRAS